MKRVKHLVIGLSIIAFVMISSIPSYAGCKQRYRWEGIGIALGSMALLGTLYSWTHPPAYAAFVTPACPPTTYYYTPPVHGFPGIGKLPAREERDTGNVRGFLGTMTHTADGWKDTLSAATFLEDGLSTGYGCLDTMSKVSL